MPVEIRNVDNVWEIRRLAEHIGLPYTTLHGMIRRVHSRPRPTCSVEGCVDITKRKRPES